MNEPRDSAPRRLSQWWANPAVGVLFGAAVVLMSYLVGSLDFEPFIKGLGAVLVGALAAVGVFTFVFGSRVTRMVQSTVSKAIDKEFSTVRDANQTLTAAVTRVQAVLDTHSRMLSDQNQLSDDNLAIVEASSRTEAVTICRRFMGDEFDRDDAIGQRFEQTVRDNLEKGVLYTWLTEANPPSHSRAALVQDRFVAKADQIEIRLIPPGAWKSLPFNNEVVFIRQKRLDGTHETLGYQDISNDQNGALWRRLGKRELDELFYEADQALKRASDPDQNPG